MTQEEKAKAYDEAKQMAKHALDCDRNRLVSTDKPLIFSMFSELKESEDERVRKWLIDTIKAVSNDSVEWDVIDKSDILTWLETHKYTEKDLDKAYKCADKIQYTNGYNDAEEKILTDFEKSVKLIMQEAIDEGDTHNFKADAEMLLRLAEQEVNRKESLSLWHDAFEKPEETKWKNKYES